MWKTAFNFFVKDTPSLWNIPLQIFKRSLPQILLGLFLSTFSQIFISLLCTKSIRLVLIAYLLEVERANKSYVERKPFMNIYASIFIERKLCFFSEWARSKICLQLCRIIWGLVWVKISYSVELLPAQFPRLFCVP